MGTPVKLKSVPTRTAKRRLTEIDCRTARPAESDYQLHDDRGLYLFIRPTGFRSWRWKYRFAGKERRMVLGAYPDLSLSAARQVRDTLRQQLREGVDPAVKRKQAAAVGALEADQTFEAVARRWHKRMAARTWTARYAKTVLGRLELDAFPLIGTLPIGQVTPALVLKVLRRAEQRGALEVAHKLRGHISDVFGFAVPLELARSNPAAAIAKALEPTAPRRRPALRTIEHARTALAKIEAVPGAHPATRLAARLLALTAIRPGVVRIAEIDEFEGLDTDQPVWRVPAAKMKLTRARKNDAEFEFLLPLSPAAVELVKFARERFARGGLLLPGNQGEEMSDSTLSKLFRAAGLTGQLVPHGWRATFSTVMNERAAIAERPGDRAVIDLMLAHLPPGVEPIYNRYSYMRRRREIADEWADLLLRGARPLISLL